jgi:HEAT repeat protein
MSNAGLFLSLVRKQKERTGVALAVWVLLLVVCRPAGFAQGQPPQPGEHVTDQATPDAPLELYHEALTNKGSSEQMRTQAANLLLFSENPAARKILLKVLTNSENSPARVAVCRVLSKASLEQKPIEKREDFIAPLVEILRTEQDASTAESAAEAMLVFDYEQVAELLGGVVADRTLPPQARLNVVYALKLQPDKKAVLKLFDLLGGPDEQVSAAAKHALESLGTLVGKDGQNIEQTRIELQRQSDKEFLRNLVIRWVTRNHGLEGELVWWKKQCRDALDKAYGCTDEEAAKATFLAECLSSPKEIIRLWGLEKVSQSWIGGATGLSAELGPILVDLISDPDREVRLRTAELLSLMGELNSAEQLLRQLSIEKDDEVRTELFVALGVAVDYGLLPDSSVKISPEIAKQTLEHAIRYLFEDDKRKAREGAEVIRKLLERNGMAAGGVGEYLGLIAKRFEQEKGKADGMLRGELLGKMAGLCGPGSTCKAEAAEIYGPLFEKALTEKTDLVRQAAVEGLIYISKTGALARFRQSDLAADPSPKIRKGLINLAAEVGGAEDLPWLWEEVATGTESASAWGAMLRILSRSELAVVGQWMGKLDSSAVQGTISDDKMLSLLEIAEQKAVGKENAKMLNNVWTKLAQIYRRTGKFEQAADYLGRLHDAAESTDEKEAIVPALLDVYLRWPKTERAARLVNNYLLTQDLEPNSPVVLSIEGYLSEPPAGVDPNEVLAELIAKTVPVANRPKWQELLQRWGGRLGRAYENPSKPGKTGS